MVKALKAVAVFLIIFFLIRVFDEMVRIAKWISGGNHLIEIAFYVAIFLLFLNYVGRPIIFYLSRPSLKQIEKIFASDNINSTSKGDLLKLKKYIIKNIDLDEQQRKQLTESNELEDIRENIKEIYIAQMNNTDELISNMATKVTSAVLISPNTFIDALTIIFSNIRLIHLMSKKVGIRYYFKDYLRLYASILTISATTGLIEEFDDEIAEFIEELGEEIGEATSQKIPFISVIAGSVSPLLQASANYRFVVFSGLLFKNSVLNSVEGGIRDRSEVVRISRTEARKKRKQYYLELLQKTGKSLHKITIKNKMKFSRGSSD